MPKNQTQNPNLNLKITPKTLSFRFQNANFNLQKLDPKP
jgi:hypothetical protein